MFVCVRVEVVGVLFIVDFFGVVFAFIVDFIVDFRFVGCYRGVVESFFVGYCRGRRVRRVGLRFFF